MANIEELKSVFTNNKLGYLRSGTAYFLIEDGYVSSTLASANYAYALAGHTGGIAYEVINNTNTYNRVFCVQR